MLFVRKATQDLAFSGRTIFKEGDILTLEGKDGLYFLKNSLGIGGFSSLEEVNEFTRELNNFEISAFTEEMQQELLERVVNDDFTKNENNQEELEELEQELQELWEESKKLTDALEGNQSQIEALEDEINYISSSIDDSNKQTFSKQEIARMSFNELLEILSS